MSVAARLMAAVGALVATALPAVAAETPKRGGILNFAVVAEPPGIDCHSTSTFAVSHPIFPHYSTLLRFAGNHASMKVVGDLAESWEMSSDGLSYTFRLHKDVKFHDGAPLTSADVKASYWRIINPPQGVTSVRKALHADIKDIETPDAHTVVFRMKQANVSILTQFASPWNCIYREAKLKDDPQFPEKTVLGTGAFTYVDYKRGESWEGKRFDGYFRKDRPYLDGYKAFFVKSNAVVPGMIGGQFDAEFRGRTPKERDQLLEAMGDKVIVDEGPWITCMLFTFNTERKPFDDPRVRQALTHAIDRKAGSQSLSKISVMKYVGGLTRPGYEFNLPPEELAKLPGYWPDINKAREEAKRLLKEAGVSNLKVKLVNRNVAEPYTPAGIYLIDQWKRIGVETEHTQLETKLFFDAQAAGSFDVLVEFISDFADDPSAQFDKLLTGDRSPQAASRHRDTMMNDLFDKQARTIDKAERIKVSREFEIRALTQAYSAPILWWQRIVVLNKKVKGWENQANHFTGQSLVDVWLDQ